MPEANEGTSHSFPSAEREKCAELQGERAGDAHTVRGQ